MGSTKKSTLTFVIGASVTCAVAWGVLYLLLGQVVSDFNAKVGSTFIAFLFIPVLFLAFTKRGMELGKIDSGLVKTMVVYQAFAFWIVAYYFGKPDFFVDYDLLGTEYLVYLAMVVFYVPPVDFFTRRMVHLEIEKVYGLKMGFAVGTLAWVVGHAGEIVWLSKLTGLAGSSIFILVTGLVTSYLYQRYKNIWGLMIGHWVLNLIVSIITSSLQV